MGVAPGCRVRKMPMRACSEVAWPPPFVFFFSSRRRHTRCSRDWSSDVCSSDLSACALEKVARWVGCAAAYPPHLATFASAQAEYSLDGRNELRVPLTWSEGALRVTKTFVFHRGEYRIDVQYEVDNGGGAPWTARPYARILRDDPPTKRSMFNVESYSF